MMMISDSVSCLLLNDDVDYYFLAVVVVVEKVAVTKELDFYHDVDYDTKHEQFHFESSELARRIHTTIRYQEENFSLSKKNRKKKDYYYYYLRCCCYYYYFFHKQVVDSNKLVRSF